MTLRRALAAFLLLSGAGAVAGAAGPIGLDALPSLLEITVAPGEAAERIVTLTNPGTAPLDVSARTSDWSMSEQGEIRFRETGTTEGSCAGWVTIAPGNVRVPAGGQAVVHVRVATPADFSGTRWAAVLFAMPVSDSAWEGRRVAVAPRVGVTIYVTAAGTEREDFRLSASSASRTPGAAGLRLEMRVENGGNTAVRFRSTWQLRSADARLVRSYEVRSSVALPGGRREVSLEVNEPIPAGVYLVTGMVRWGSKRWAAMDSQLTVPPARPGI